MATKRGRLGRSEQKFIETNAEELTAKQIADKLGRTEEAVRIYLKKIVRVKKAAPLKTASELERTEISKALRQSEKWKRLKQEFTSEEMAFFQDEYVQLMAQFNGDVLRSEETQIFDCIRLDILKSRNMIARRKALQDIGRLERTQEQLIEHFGGELDHTKMTDDQQAFALQLENQLGQARATEKSSTTEYVKLQERHDALMKSLKSTRDQRLKVVEGSRVNFIDLIKTLMERDRQETEGRQAGLMSKAAEEAYTRLGRPTKYEDGNVDNPILSADTVDLDAVEDQTAESSDV